MRTIKTSANFGEQNIKLNSPLRYHSTMKGFTTFFLVTVFILKSNTVIVDFNQNNVNTTVKLQNKPKFTSHTLEHNYFTILTMSDTIPYGKSEVQFQRKIIVQNNCDNNNFYDEVNKSHHCPTIGNFTAYDKVYTQDGVYYIVQECSAMVSGKLQNYTWIITDRDAFNVYDLMNSNEYKHFVIYGSTSCLGMCLSMCKDKDVIDLGIEFRLNDFIVLIILILFFCGFLVFYPCGVFLRKCHTSNQVQAFQ